MLTLVLHALRARRGQSVSMFALALLAALGCAAAPWFLAWGGDAVSRLSVADAPVAERIVLVDGSVRYEAAAGSPLDVLRQRLAEHLPLTGARTEVGARAYVSAGRPQDETAPARRESTNLNVVTRDDVCAQVGLVAGRCPNGAGEVLLSRRAAEALGVGLGDQVEITGVRLSSAATLTVTGVYEIPDPYSDYWAGTELLPAVQLDDDRTPDPMLVSEVGFLALPLDGFELQAKVTLPDDAFTDPDSKLGQLLVDAQAFNDDGLEVHTAASDLVDRIAHDRFLLLLGVGIGAAQLVLVSWVGLFLAVRHTSQERRADIALLKLRGTATRRVWTMVGLSSGLPMLAGTLLGVVFGFGAGAALAGSLEVVHTIGIDPAMSLSLSLAAAALAGLGGLVVAVAAERRTIRTPVADLLRRVPARQRGWRSDVVDLVMVVLAAAGVYQGRLEPGSVFALLAPALVGLAVALLVGRALPVVAARLGASALRAGRVGGALAALALARRQGMHRIFVVLAVAAAVFTTTTMLWHSASLAWEQRAVQELGADRVLTVDAPSATALLAAVRAADPSGSYAMAVASTPGSRTEDRIVAVDTTRLAQVGRLVTGSPAALAALLRPPAHDPLSVADGSLTLDASAPSDLDGVALRLNLSTVDGEAVAADFPLGGGRSAVMGEITGCSPACRLVSLEVVAPPAARQVGVTVEVFGLTAASGPVLNTSTLGDIARWRTTFSVQAVPPTLQAGHGRLAITLPNGPVPEGKAIDTRALPLTTPTPLPVVVAGPAIRPSGGDARVTALGGTGLPFQVVGTAPALPTVGARGVLADLEYVLRGNDDATEHADLAVWLRADAPDTIVAALADHGVRVLSSTSVSQRRAALAGHGPGLALRFGYFSVLVVLLLAGGVAVVGSTVERFGRVAELTALRVQGLSTRATRMAGYAGVAVMVAAAALTGVVAALLAQALVDGGLPVFSDDWEVLPVPSGLTPLTLLLAVGVTLAVLGTAALWGAARLVAAVRKAER